MNVLDYQYQSLLRKILSDGVEKKDRTGTGTISIFGQQIRHKMSHGFPLLTTKKMAWKTIVTELLWFLRGDTNIKYLLDNNCHIWDGDAYKQYERLCTYDGHEPRHTKEELMDLIQNDPGYSHYGNLGLIYGKQWRDWNVRNDDSYDSSIDQISTLIYELKTNPDSRRLMVNAWNVGELDQMVLPPCHYGFQVYTRELSKFERSRHMGLPEGEHFLDDVLDKHNIPKRAISLMWNQRSVDTFLGLPFNIASYGLLLEIIAKEINMVPDELIGNLGDVHLYSNHIEQAKEQINREPFELPKLGMDYRKGEYNKDLTDLIPDDFYLINYQSHPTIKAPLSN